MLWRGRGLYKRRIEAVEKGAKGGGQKPGKGATPEERSEFREFANEVNN